MFGGFSNRIDPATKRRMALSFAGALVVYVALGGAVVAGFGGAVMATNDKEHDVDVTFFKALPPPPPPAPLPPPPVPAVEPAKAAAPAPAPAPKAMPKPIAPKSNTPPAPKTLPTDKPDEGKDPGKSETPVKPSDDPLPGSSATGSGNGSGDPNATGTGDPNSKGTGTGTGTGDGTGTGSAPVVLPPGAIAPVLVGALVTEADYPRGAREARIEGVVKVKVVVQVDGTVTLVKFLQHDENFDQAVLAILKRIRYKPAVYNGQPIAVYKNLSFPFEMD